MQASTSRTGVLAGSSSKATALSEGEFLITHTHTPTHKKHTHTHTHAHTHTHTHTHVRFKSGPPSPGDPAINFFDVAGSTLTITDDGKPLSKGKKFGFMVRFMQMTRFVERSFHLDSEEERDQWVRAYEDIKRCVMQQASARALTQQTSSVTPESASDDATSMEDFEMLKVLGKGTFGKVMLGKHKATGVLYAIKVLKKSVILAKDEVAHTMTENAVLQSTDHPFLTGLKFSFQTKDLLCFVMEYVNGGELFFHLSREKVFTEDRARVGCLALIHTHAHTYIRTHAFSMSYTHTFSLSLYLSISFTHAKTYTYLLSFTHTHTHTHISPHTHSSTLLRLCLRSRTCTSTTLFTATSSWRTSC